ncbi:Ribosome-interacting GTPase 1 domain protein [Penicillium digitatum]|uniref:Ribosome-interacting GTPase 1 domain protein n=1 Tax=Penicillium digitatum TaxID=36651 RepID=A0A7T7BM34_PENDI|nr:Ribosome-interacting GTPase 1 domain protein [Penicillium digitatum]
MFQSYFLLLRAPRNDLDRAVRPDRVMHNIAPAIFGAPISIDEFKFKGLETVRNRDWCEDLKPPVHNPQPTIPRKRSQSHRLVHERSASDSHPSHTAGPAPLSPATPVFNLETPRPDRSVGLSDESLVNNLEPKMGRSTARSFLLDLQDTTSLVSDPHVTPLGLRFPFLIVEVKAGSTRDFAKPFRATFCSKFGLG